MKTSETKNREIIPMSNKNNKSAFLLSILLIIVLFVGFSILVPKTAADLYSQKRQILWNDFYANLKTKDSIDPRNFWRFREFYSPGSFIFDRKGISDTNLSVDTAKIGINKSYFGKDLVFLRYDSKRMSSIDSLTDRSSIDLISNSFAIKNENIILKKSDYLLIKKNEKNYLLIFILPESEMERANGYFDYLEKDKALVKGKYWLDMTLISID
jgi:hypothetical protein